MVHQHHIFSQFCSGFNKEERKKSKEIAYGSSLPLLLYENLHLTKNKVPNTVAQSTEVDFAERESNEKMQASIHIISANLINQYKTVI